jgi:hypothetical protein
MADNRDDALIAELRDLAGWLELPATPDAGRMTATIVARVGAPPPPRPWWSRRWRALVAAAAAVVVAVAVVPPARAAVVDAIEGVLRFGGIEISDEPPGSLPATPSPLPSIRSVALDEARRIARFPVQAPAVLGPPESVELADPAPDGAPRIVTLIYRGGTVRLDQFDGSVDPYFYKKGAQGAQYTTVNGDSGIWVPGPHALTYVDRDGVTQTATGRLAGPTLIWSGGNVTYRLEGLAALSEARTIAESMT